MPAEIEDDDNYGLDEDVDEDQQDKGPSEDALTREQIHAGHQLGEELAAGKMADYWAAWEGLDTDERRLITVVRPDLVPSSMPAETFEPKSVDHPDFARFVKEAERSVAEHYQSVTGGRLRVDSELYEAIADTHDLWEQREGEARGLVAQVLANLLESASLQHYAGEPFGQVFQRKNWIGADLRHRLEEVDGHGHKRVTIDSRAETEAGMAAVRTAVAAGEDPNPEPMSPEYVAAREALTSGEGSISARFGEITSPGERGAFLKSLSTAQAAALEDEIGAL